MNRVWTAVLVLVFVGAAAVASAQKKPAAKKGTAAAKGPKPKAFLRIDTGDTVKGTIQKPEAFYVLPRTTLNFEGLSLKKSFVPKIFESLRKPPF